MNDEPRPRSANVKPAGRPATFEYRNLKQGEFWRHIPAYRDVDEATFLDHLWQQRNSVKTADELLATIKESARRRSSPTPRGVPARADVRTRLALRDRADRLERSVQRSDPHAVHPARLGAAAATIRASRSTRCTSRPTRRSRASRTATSTRRSSFRSTRARSTAASAPAATRSASTPKTSTRSRWPRRPSEWEDAFEYIASRPELEDIVISGGDTYQLPPKNIELIGDALLDIPHVRRMRFATKGPAVMPMKILTDTEWVDALTASRRSRPHDGQGGRAPHALQLSRRDHVDHREGDARALRARHHRAQSVGAHPRRQRHARTMQLLVKRLGYINVHPYYVYMHDMVKGVEDLRTTIQHRDRHREVRARHHGRLQHADCSSATRPAAAASATCTPTSTTTARTASPSTRRRASNRARRSSTSIRSTSSRPTRRRAGPCARFKTK